jgi:hypothetical protein
MLNLRGGHDFWEQYVPIPAIRNREFKYVVYPLPRIKNCEEKTEIYFEKMILSATLPGMSSDISLIEQDDPISMDFLPQS